MSDQPTSSSSRRLGRRSCWSAVIERLQADGYNVTAPQFPETSVDDDVARLREVLARQDGPTVIAGHSYGGHIMTALGTATERRSSCLYRSIRPRRGRVDRSAARQGPPTPALAHLSVDERGFGWLAEDDFVNHFAGDIDPVKAKVMYAGSSPFTRRRSST